LKQEDKVSYNIIQPLLLSACVAIGMMIGYKMNEKPENSLVSVTDYPLDSMMMTGRVEELIRFIESKYVTKVNSDELIETALTAVFDKLDPHSMYLSPAEVGEVNDQMDGAYNGIGIENFMIDDTVNISSVIHNSPAYKTGLKSFDKIISIDNKIVAGKSLEYNEIRKMLNLDKGTEIRLTVLRDKKLLPYVLTVDEVPVRTIVSEFIPDIKTVLIKIERFGSNTYKEFMEDIEKHFSNNKAQHLIIDLRDNPGGFLPEATNILCQIFEEKDKMLLYTEGRNNKKNEYKSNGKRFFKIDQVAVLIDENSASASEIIAGAIQDWDRGIIIGRRSYGKGLVQEQYNLTNGGAIRLTVARYYTPSGRSIQRDYSDRSSYDEDYDDRYQNGDLFHKDSLATKNGQKFYTQVLKREVSGFGGITPDIFIPLDLAFKNEQLFGLRSLLPEFAFRYASLHKKEIPNKIDNFNEWNLPDNIHLEFGTFVQTQMDSVIVMNTATMKNLDNELKSNIARFLFDEKTFLANEIKNDAFVSEAVRAIKENKTTVLKNQ
jgi:carboxyl-terminal processing protease